MALKPCRECKTEISDIASTCPKCGAPSEIQEAKDALVKGGTMMLASGIWCVGAVFFLGIAVIIILVIASMVSG